MISRMSTGSMQTLSGLEMFLLLAMGHFVGDFAFQGDRMAVEKCPGKNHTLSWKWWLTAHAAIHAFLVALLTGVVWLGVAEWILHGAIDIGKCRHRYGMGGDQLLHVTCKAIWAVIVSTDTLRPGAITVPFSG